MIGPGKNLRAAKKMPLTANYFAVAKSVTKTEEERQGTKTID